MERNIKYHLPKKIQGESLEEIQEKATDYGNALETMNDTVSPEMMCAIAGFINDDPKFKAFLNNPNPSVDDVVKFIMHLSKNWGSKVSGSLGGKLKGIFGL